MAVVWLAFSAAGCATHVPQVPLALRSTIGSLTLAQFERELAPGIPGGSVDAEAARRRAAEDWLVERALAREARRLRLDRAPAARALLSTRRDDVLVALVEARVEAGVAAPDGAAVAAFLGLHQAETAGAEKLSLRHVFQRLSRSASEAERERARARMETVRARLLAGEDFAALARAESDSETAKFGGQITPVARGQLPPAADAVVWRLAPGEVSPVVVTPVGLHVFRLEARLPPEPLTPEQAQAWARLRVATEARMRARHERFEAWRRESRAIYRPEALAAVRAVPEALVFRLGDSALRVRDLEARRAGLGFAAGRLTTSAELLETEAWRRLALWSARRERLSRTPEARAALERARRRTLAQLAAEARLRRWQAQLPESELRATFDLDPSRFADHARLRVRVVVLSRRDDRSLQAAFDALDALAVEVRAGRRDLVEAARDLSDDPSGPAGGDLGFVSLKDLQEWAGPTCGERIAALPTGTLSAPLLVESYREPKLAYEPGAYLLARVEERRDPPSPRFEDVRAQVAGVYLMRHAPQADAAVRADVLREVEAEFFLGAGAR